MLPKTQTENAIFWLAAFVLSFFIAFLTSWLEQATTIPEDAPILWRPIFIDLASWLVTSLPIAAAGLLGPKFGREEVSARVSELGKKEAIMRLDTPMEVLDTRGIDYGVLADEVLKRKRLEDAQQQVRY